MTERNLGDDVADCFKQWNEQRELIQTYDEYIELLGQSETASLEWAYAHGYSVPTELVKRGEQLRAKIAKLKAELFSPNNT